MLYENKFYCLTCFFRVALSLALERSDLLTPLLHFSFTVFSLWFALCVLQSRGASVFIEPVDRLSLKV